MNHTDAVSESALGTTVLLDYLRFQTASSSSKPAAATINRRVGVVECALRSTFPDANSPFAPQVSQFLLAAFAAR